MWNVEVFENLDYQIKALVDGLNDLDELASTRDLNADEVATRRKVTTDLWSLKCRKVSLLYQKSMSRWLKLGDANSSYFHASINSRRRFHRILALQHGNRWFEWVKEVRSETVRHFNGRFSESVSLRPHLDGVPFKQISLEDNALLTSCFTQEEIKEAVWSCDGDKSPSPDGFNFTFFKKLWDVIKEEGCGMIHEFHLNASLPKGVCSSFIALIPKNENPQGLDDFRSTSLIGSIHKLIQIVSD